MKIKVKLILSYILTVSILISTGIVELKALYSVKSDLEDFYHNSYNFTIYMDSMNRAIRNQYENILNAILETDRDSIDYHIENAYMNFNIVKDMLSDIRNLYFVEITEVHENIKQIEELLNKTVVYRDKIFDLVQHSENEEAFYLMKNEYTPVLNNIDSLLLLISDIAKQDADMKILQSKKSIKFSLISIYIIIAIGIFFIVTIGFCISNITFKKKIEIDTDRLSDDV